MTENKNLRKRKNFTLEEIYQNKNFVQPKEQSLETIFEEPREAKNGIPIFTSVRKYRRYLDFDITQGKVLKRKKNAKKCIKRIGGKRKTRSASKAFKEEDISLILEGLSDTSDDSLMDTTFTVDDSMDEDNRNDSSVYISDDIHSTTVGDISFDTDSVISNDSIIKKDGYDIILAKNITVRVKRLSNIDDIVSSNNDVIKSASEKYLFNKNINHDLITENDDKQAEYEIKDQSVIDSHAQKGIEYDCCSNAHAEIELEHHSDRDVISQKNIKCFDNTDMLSQKNTECFKDSDPPVSIIKQTDIICECLQDCNCRPSDSNKVEQSVESEQIIKHTCELL